MTTIRGSMLLGAALLIGSISGAQAADLYDGGYKGSMKDSAIEGPASWYIRGDIAFGHHDDPILLEQGIFDLTESSFDSTWSIGGGIGRYFTNSLRGDLTYDYRVEADVTGTQADPWVGAFPGERVFGLQSHVFLANMYYDFNRDGRFNPYLGVGLGFTRNTTTGNKNPITGTIASCGCTSQTFEASFEGDDETHVAAALMAGFSLKIRDRMHIDAGYRFLYLGKAHTGDINGSITTDTGTGGVTVAADGGDPIVKDIHAHEIRIGFRYDIHR